MVYSQRESALCFLFLEEQCQKYQNEHFNKYKDKGVKSKGHKVAENLLAKS